MKPGHAKNTKSIFVYLDLVYLGHIALQEKMVYLWSTIIFSQSKVLNLFLVYCVEAQSQPSEELLDQRRFSDLAAIAKHIFVGAGKSFDIRKYYAYGCNCFQLGDAPLSGQPIQGRPVDQLDNMCKMYKSCQKCVRTKNGETCRGELVKYQWTVQEDLDVTGSNDAGSCERELFECDRQFAFDLLEV